MMAVFKREFKAYFTSVTGWIFLAAFFFVFDLYFVANNLVYGYPYISYALMNVVFVFIIIIPILAMRSMAEDRRTKTDQLLYTSPVSIPKVIFGKYLSMVAILSIGFAAVCLCPLLMSLFGTVPFGQSYTVILGVWLFGCLAIAVSMFLSSVTESQVIAAVLSFALLFVGYMMQGITGLISSEGNVLTKILNCLSISAPLDNFSNGILDLAGIVYYVSGSALFLFLTCQLIQKYRWSVSSKKITRGVFNTSFVVIGLAIVVAVNIFANELPDNIKNIDVTSQNLYSLTDDTYTLLDTVDQDIDIYVLEAEDSADDTVAKTLDRYEDASSHISVQYIDPAVSPNFYTTYTDSAPTDGSLIVVCGDRSKVIDYSDIYEYTFDYSTYSSSVSAYDGEGQITSAISYVLNEELPVVYLIDGHGESSLDSSFSDALEKLNMSVESITLLQEDEIPEDAAAIIINGPTSDFSQDDAQKVIDYLANGGKALIMTSYEAADDMTNFDSILAEYNIEVGYGIVMEGDNSYCYQYPFYLLPDVQSSDLTSNVDGYIFAPYAQMLTNLDSENEELEWTDLLLTSSSAYLKTDISNMTTYSKEDGDVSGTFTLAANVSDTTTGAQVTVVASSLIFTDNADSMVSGQNLAMFKGIASTYSDSEVSVSIDAKSYSVDYLTVNQAVSITAELLLVVVLPIVLIVLGVVIWYRRRKA
jgi:ABC-2 type transport system permease protein